MLKVERSANGTVLSRLSGRIEKADVEDLRCLLSLESLDRLLALEMSDVTYVDPTPIAFLRAIAVTYIFFSLAYSALARR